MIKNLFVLVLLPALLCGQCILRVTHCEWVPPDAAMGDTITKCLWLTNLGTAVCDTTTFEIALASWGLWLEWEIISSMTIPFLYPGDTVVYCFKEIRQCNETLHDIVAESEPLYVDHYDFIEAPADSGVCDTFWVGNPIDDTIHVVLTIDEVSSTWWDVVIFPTDFFLGPGDSAAISVCTEYTGWCEDSLLWWDSLWWWDTVWVECFNGIGGLLRAADVEGLLAGRTDNKLRFARYRELPNYDDRLPSVWPYTGFERPLYVTIIQNTDLNDVNGAYKAINIQINNSFPFEHNITFDSPYIPTKFTNTSFRAVNPENPYYANIPSSISFYHSSFTDVAGSSESQSAITITGADTFRATQLLIQNTHNTPALEIQSPFSIKGLIIRDASSALKIYSGGIIQDFQYENISTFGPPVYIYSSSPTYFIASHLTPADVAVRGTGSAYLCSRVRILVEDTLGNPLSNVQFQIYRRDELVHFGVTNSYGGSSSFPIKWAEITQDGITEDRNIRFVIQKEGYETIYTIGTLNGIQDWFRLPMVPLAGLADSKPPIFSISVIPNPFNAVCNFVIDGNPTKTALEIFDICGKKVAQFELVEGHNEIVWETSNEPSGIYFYRIILLKENCIGSVFLVK